MAVAKRMAGMIAALAAAALAATVLGIVLQSQFVLAGLRGLGARIGVAESLRFTLDDIIAMTPFYGLELIAPAFLVAFVIAGLLQSRTPVPRAVAFTIAGGSAIGVLLTGIVVFEGIHPIAGSRGWAGMACQCAAGAAGGLLFARLTRQKAPRPGRVAVTS
jgi:hypothetical protein